MAEFYGYQEKLPNYQIDWSKIGSDLTKTLENEVKSREEQKAAIDQATAKTLETLRDAPQGLDNDVNKFTTQYANGATNAMLLANKLMKSGKMSVQDYTYFMANMNSDTNYTFNLNKKYNETYAKKIERMNSQDPATKSQSLETDLNGFLEEFKDLSKSNPLFDPKTGKASIGIMQVGKDGVPTLTKKVMTAQDIYKALELEFNYFQSDKNSTGIAKVLAPTVLATVKEGSLNTKGQVITVDDALQNPNTAKAIDDAINSFFVNQPHNMQSILTNDIGGKYHNVFTEEERAKDPEYAILNVLDLKGYPTPQFTEKQKKAAYEYMKTQVYSKIKHDEDIKLFESAEMDKARLDLEREKSKTNRLNAEANYLNATKGQEDYSNSWTQYVNDRVPDVAAIYKSRGTMSDEEVINQLNSNFQGFDLKFVQGPSGKESIKIIDNSYKVPRETIVYMNDPNAQQIISDYIRRERVEKGLQMIKVGEIKNVKGNVGGGVGIGSQTKSTVNYGEK